MPPYVSLLAMIRIWSTFGVAQPAYCADRLRRLRRGDPAGIRIRAPPAELECSGVFRALAHLRIALMPDSSGFDSTRVHVEVVAVTPERLDAPQHVEVLVEMRPEPRLLGSRVAVANDDHRETLRPGRR